MTSRKPPEWQTEQEICSYDVDPHRTVRLPALCRFMQEAAFHHAEQLGLGRTFLTEEKLGWVLSRQRIAVGRLPKWGEQVSIRTWPSGRDKLFFYRDFEITDGAGARILAASNAWTLIEMETHGRAHPGRYLTVEIPEMPGVFDSKLRRLRSVDGAVADSVAVTYGDLDVNGHVNNVRYIEWILNSLPQSFHEAHCLQALELNFLAEAVYGQTVLVGSTESRPGQFDHVIRSGETELFRAQSIWRPSGD
jgi:acyl-ACP thioesterase